MATQKQKAAARQNLERARAVPSARRHGGAASPGRRLASLPISGKPHAG